MTFVLVHGAWHGPWCWSRVSERLTGLGHRVLTPDLGSDVAGAGAEDYVAAIGEVLRGESDVVLVGHSMSGLVVPAAANPAVRSLVLLAAMVAAPGSTWLVNGPAPYAGPMREYASRMKVDESGRTSWDPADATDLMYHDCQPADAAQAVARLRPDATGVYAQPLPSLTTKVPATYVSCRQDRAIDGAWNAAAARDLYGADVRELDTGHSPFWSAPDALAALLDDLAGGQR